ncbi:MAG: hypothetical protein IPK60_25725 [Sandaracinaceae bacterium]|nr:hypothetical protein [Sandaracinaceae bacterium]
MLRKAHPYSLYERFDFEVPIGHDGDNYDRFLVRTEEMRQSMRILEQAVAQMPDDGPINVEDVRIMMPPKDQVYNTIEGTIAERVIGTSPPHVRTQANRTTSRGNSLRIKGGYVNLLYDHIRRPNRRTRLCWLASQPARMGWLLAWHRAVGRLISRETRTGCARSRPSRACGSPGRTRSRRACPARWRADRSRTLR